LIKTSHDPDVTDDVWSEPLQQCINLLATANNIDVLADVFHDYNLDVEEFQKDLYGAHEILARQDEANVDKPRRAARERLDRCLNKLQSAS
jgi:F0F1-type ATP synthase epsilon subunit